MGCCSSLRMDGCRRNVENKNFKLFSIRKAILENFQQLLANSRDTYLGETIHVQLVCSSKNMVSITCWTQPGEQTVKSLKKGKSLG